MNILNELKDRDILDNITSEEKFNKLPLNSGIYIGFDPTATSLHLGNYIQISILKRFQKAGYKIFAIVGGATGMIGDPSGKSEERNLLSQDTLKTNKIKIKKQLESFGLNVIDNLDFYKNTNVLEFLRDTGKLLNVSYMLNKEIVKNRIEQGISFTEFSYQLIQGWDFYNLYKNYDVKVQIGGSDQWGNITAGTEIIRKKIGDKYDAVGITTKLLTTSSGKKFGKSEGNALFIDKNLTSPFEIHQYMLNVSDEDVEKMLKWLTFLSLDKISEIVKKHSQNLKDRLAQKILANEVIKDIYSETELEGIEVAQKILFGNENVTSLTTDQVLSLEGLLPTFTSNDSDILNLLLLIKAASSKREAREFIENNAIEVNGNKISEIDYKIKKDCFDGKATIIKRGRKKFFLIKH